MAILIQSLSWTLIYALGQGFLVYASLWLVLKLMPSMSANVKYHLSLSALTVLLAWFAGTWWQQYHSLGQAYERAMGAQASNTISLQKLQASGAIDSNGWYQRMSSSVDVVMPWLSLCYVAGLLLMLVRLSGGMLQLFSLRRDGLTKAEAALDELLISLKRNLHLEGPVQLFISAKAQVPMVIGFLKPMILMPASAMTQLSMEQVETLLLHELAHIKRHDYLVNILQTVVETVLFFNPFVWMISSITRREREHCCDDLVLEHSREPLYYATALATLASNEGVTAAFAVAATGKSNHLFNRIKRIMEMKKNPFSYSRTAAAILLITTIGCSIAWLTPSFAGDNESKNKDKAVEALQANSQDESKLVQKLSMDGIVDEITGFVVEKRQDKLFINGKQQSDEMASKYLSGLTKDVIRVEVFPFIERLKMHPEQGLIQNLVPVSMSSKCVQYTPKKGPGC